MARYIRDPRYIRVNGKPLVVLYRPSLLPDALQTAGRWRKWCSENGIGEIFLAYTQSFENEDPRVYGFDAAIEFPPNNSNPPDITDRVIPVESGFNGRVYDWSVFLRRSENYSTPDYKLFRSVCPGWDNTARRKDRGTVFVNNSPALYQRWLENAVKESAQRFSDHDERIVFVNAWNEWAEGAHLEPDVANGYAYLEATRAAIDCPEPGAAGGALVAGSASRSLAGSSGRLIIVGHDAYQHGGQYLALHLVRTMAAMLNYEVDFILLGEGPLTDAYAQWARVHRMAGATDAEVAALAASLYEQGARLAICNTVVSAAVLPQLHDAGLRVIVLVHELPNVIRQYALEGTTLIIARLAHKVVFAAEPIARGFESFASLDPVQREIRPQGLYHLNALRRQAGGLAQARRELRISLGIPAAAPIVLGVGYADRRKGIDLYVSAGVRLLKQHPDAWFVWLGRDAEPEWMVEAKREAVEAGVISRFVFPGFVEKPDLYFAGSDVFALTSREDPFPSVVLDSMDCGLPVVAFAGTGGMESLLNRYGGLVVAAFDVDAYADALGCALTNVGIRDDCARNGPQIIDSEFSMQNYAQDILYFGGAQLRVSVVVPNYNYARYIVERLLTIVTQTCPIYELIVLDDKSSDDSVTQIEQFLANSPVPSRLVVNGCNSGSVFAQWRKGAELARGDLLWIAEADDLAHPDFLAAVVPAFADRDVVMSYCQSRQIDGDGRVLGGDYLDYVADIDAARWRTGYTAPGSEEIAEGLYLKNTIPNVSAVVFRREALLAVLRKHSKEIMELRNAGDWLAYLRLLEDGHIAFDPRALNDHRRHQNSVTIGNANRRHLDEIIAIQTQTIERHRLGEGAARRARAYAEKVAQQFGLTLQIHN